jgi:hypothetical protein
VSFFGRSDMDANPFLERSFEADSTELTVRFYRPGPDPSGIDYRCDYAIEWPVGRRTGFACGVDEIQALILAMQRAHVDLLSSPAYAAGTLLWLGMRELGLPLPTSVTTSAFQDPRRGPTP